MIATRKREVTARKTAGENAKRRRAEHIASRAVGKSETETDAARTKGKVDESDDEVEDLDDDIVAAVADRDLRAVRARDATARSASRQAKRSAKASRRLSMRAAREEREGYVGDGKWVRDGYEVVVAEASDDGRPSGAEAARAFLNARRDAGGRHKRSSSMLLDPKTGKPIRAGGIAELGVGKKR